MSDRSSPNLGRLKTKYLCVLFQVELILTASFSWANIQNLIKTDIFLTLSVAICFVALCFVALCSVAYLALCHPLSRRGRFGSPGG